MKPPRSTHTLIYVPLLHHEVNLPAVESQTAQGRAALTQRRRLLRAMWRGIAQRLDEMQLPFQRLHIYQDALPVCAPERADAIVRELAARGSLNHRLIVALQRRGATLVGTEDPQQLVQEYQRLQRVKQLLLAAQAGAPPGPTEALLQRLRREGDRLLERRDTFIERRIADTLDHDGTAVVFLGLRHRLDERVAGRCDLRVIVHNLPFWSARLPAAAASP